MGKHCPLSLPTTVKKKMDIEYFIAFFSYECLSINKNGLCSWQESFLSSDTGRSLATCTCLKVRYKTQCTHKLWPGQC